MKSTYTRWLLVGSLAIAGAVPVVQRMSRGQTAVADGKLKADVLAAARVGKFDVVDQLLDDAAGKSSDAELARMHKWSSDFEGQLKLFADERHKAYDKAVADVQHLVDKGHEDSALDLADRAEQLSDDKKTFLALPWVRTLVTSSSAHAVDAEKAGQWYRAMKLYRDLSAVEPASKPWKEKLKTTVVRVRLLRAYAPDAFKKIEDSEIKERDEVLAIINPPSPTTQPTTKPADVIENDDFKIDWHESLKGIELPMLVRAIDDAAGDYWRDVDFKQLMTGGIDGLLAVVDTRELDATFPGLADADKRAKFVAALQKMKTKVAAASVDDEEDLAHNLLAEEADGILAANTKTVDLPPEVIISEFADGAFQGLDPFTSMIWPSELAEFKKATQGEFFGIGVQIMQEKGDLKVVRPITDSPAEEAGIKTGDVIIKINGKSAKNITTDQAVKTITGPSGTMVHLSIRTPEGQVNEVNIRRRRIKVESVEGYTRKPHGKWDYYIDPTSKIAYIKITGFSESTVRELRSALNDLGDNVNGIVVDLRGNPGGLLTAAIGVCDQFLKDGAIVSTHPDRETRNKPTLAMAQDDGNEYTKPLVVLVNQYSASASEIVSGALKDDKRAILVGERTYGKGSVQQIFTLDSSMPPKAELKLTTAHYYLPLGKCIHREENSVDWGVDPDVVVPMTPEQMGAAQIARLAMETAVETSGPPAQGKGEQLQKIAPAVEDAKDKATTQPTTQATPKTLLESDPQLAAALLLMRLEVFAAK